MSVATNLLTNSGYELISIMGNSVFPCTVVKDGQPLGFILQNGTVSLLPEHENVRAELEAINTFARNHRGLEQRPEGLLMTQYQNCMLTADYDAQNRQAVYKIYERRENGEQVLLQSSFDRGQAVAEFVRVSNLAVSRAEPVPQQEQNHQQQPQYVTQEKQYRIVDPAGQEVGYIGRNGMATMYSQQQREPKRPSFLELLRKKLSEIGLSIRVHYQRKGQHYAIRDNAQRDVAYLRPEAPTEIQYTNYATPQQQSRIDAIVAEIMMEQGRTAPQPFLQEQHTVPVQQVVQEQRHVPAPQPVQEQKSVPIQQPVPEQETQEAQREKAAILHDFDMKMSEIKMMEGFNPQLSEQQTDIVMQLYGTLDREALEESIDLGHFNLRNLDQNFERAGLKGQWESLLPKAQKDQLTPPQKGEPDRA